MIKKILAYSLMSLCIVTGLNISPAEAKGHEHHDRGNHNGWNRGHHDHDRGFDNRHFERERFIERDRVIVRPIYHTTVFRPVYNRTYVRPIYHRTYVRPVIYTQPLFSINLGLFSFHTYNEAVIYSHRANLRGHRSNVVKSNGRWTVRVR